MNAFQESDFIKFMKSPEDALKAEEKPEAETPQQQWKGFKGSEHLAHLTVSNFESFIKHRDVLVMFYAPCKLYLFFRRNQRFIRQSILFPAIFCSFHMGLLMDFYNFFLWILIFQSHSFFLYYLIFPREPWNLLISHYVA